MKKILGSTGKTVLAHLLQRNKSFFFRFQSKSYGFTLIEILVVFSTVAILSGVGFASFVGYSRQQSITQASGDLRQLYQLAKFNAISSVKPSTGLCANNTLDGYRVVICSESPGQCLGSGNYELQVICGNQRTLVTSKRLPQNITFNASTTCSQVQYHSLSATSAGYPCVVVINGYGKQVIINPETSVDVTGIP